VFAHYPDLAVLGGWCGVTTTSPPNTTRRGFRRAPGRSRRWTPTAGSRLSFSRPGEPGITFEAE
jgi:hypothetical protein